MKKVIEPIMEEKIKFIQENSHILINVLNNRMSTRKTVLETITSIIICDKQLNECDDIDELKIILELNKDVYNDYKEVSAPFGVIFSVAHYVNSSVLDEKINNEIRDKLRLYTNSFNKERAFSNSYSKFVIFKPKANNEVLKKI